MIKDYFREYLTLQSIAFKPYSSYLPAIINQKYFSNTPSIPLTSHRPAMNLFVLVLLGALV